MSTTSTFPPGAEGTRCWGHDTAIDEDFAEDFSTWTGDAVVSLEDDNEIITFSSGQEEISPVTNLGAGLNAQITLNKYIPADSVTIQYKTGATVEDCNADTWHNYVPFESLGYVRVRLAVA
ncbi:unnamed protein product [marine sediment metagenome]|uniref:Uncharacterized protein n=1 Tax=marine sediment metagenome TaxID=412755 RepID=X0T516_9ZZZZ